MLNRIAWKNHRNGAVNPRAQYQKEVSLEKIAASPRVAGQLGVFDCSGVSDGAAAALICRAEDAHRYTDSPSLREGPEPGGRSGGRGHRPRLRLHHLRGGHPVGRDAYAQAGVDDPRAELAMAEVHDCFTPTELVLMEDLGFADRGTAWKEVMAGTFDRDGELPVNPDGGLKSFGHPIGATGLRMLFECWLQLRQQAPPERQIATVTEGGRTLGLTHNLGGAPGECVSFVGVVGTEPSD